MSGPTRPLPDKESDALWAARPVGTHPMSVASHQSAPLPDEDALWKQARELGRSGSALPRPDRRLGCLPEPASVEFWQADRKTGRTRDCVTSVTVPAGVRTSPNPDRALDHVLERKKGKSMCGITGWVSFDRDLTQQRTQLDAMTETMACRGPDAGGAWLDRHAALGHRRLAVIDLEGGIQPMVVPTDDGPVALTYSGEVYNFTELRSELIRRGHRFETRSDTEVVLHGYLEWGEAVAERLNGMFAFAVWDSRVEKLVMIRDRMGVKPLYYSSTDDGVLFGSEPKAILANPLADRAVDLAGLRELVSLTQTPGSALWCGMREVLPGGLVTVDRAGLREHRYWTLPTRPHTDDLKTTVATVRELLEDIVSRQLVSDVPRCTLLSGGLDSSAITALAAAKLGRPGARRARREGAHLRGRLRRHGRTTSSPTYLRGTPRTPRTRTRRPRTSARSTESIALDHAAIADPDVRRAVITARDSPFSFGDMDTSLYLLFQAIREHSTVALSGESADEVFGGYPWFHQPEVQAAQTFPWMDVFVTGPQAQSSDRFNADITAALDLPAYIRDRYSDAVGEVERAGGRGDHEMADARDVLPAPDALRPDAPGPQGPDQHGRRAGGPGPVLRPPARGVRLQHPVVDEDLRRPGEEPAARRDAPTCCPSRC